MIFRTLTTNLHQLENGEAVGSAQVCSSIANGQTKLSGDISRDI